MDPYAYFKNSEKKVIWIGVLSYGNPNSKWMKKNESFPVFDGYRGERLVLNDEKKIFRLILSVYASSLGKPLFEVKAYPYNLTKMEFEENPCQKVLHLRITPCSEILSKIGLTSKKNWNGKNFFGLEVVQVRSQLQHLFDESKVTGGSTGTKLTVATVPAPSWPAFEINSDFAGVTFQHTYNFLGIQQVGNITEQVKTHIVD